MHQGLDRKILILFFIFIDDVIAWSSRASELNFDHKVINVTKICFNWFSNLAKILKTSWGESYWTSRRKYVQTRSLYYCYRQIQDSLNPLPKKSS